MKKQTIIAAAYLSLIPILIIDKITPLGYVEWILYIIPTIVIALVAGRKSSVLFTGLCSGLVMLGFYLSPPSNLPLRAAIYNRAIGIITIWSATLLMQLYGRARVKISELAQAREELKQEKDLLQTIMNSAGKSHLVYLDRDFNFVRVNETYAKTCGYKPEEMLGKNHFDLYPHPENEAIFARVRDTGVAEEYHDKPFVFPDQPARGTTYWDWTLIPARDDAGKVLGLVFSLTETTDRKRAEEALQQSESNLARAQAITHLANWEVDIGSNVVRGSQELYRLFELRPGITLASYTEKFHPDDKMSVMKAIKASINEGQPYHIDYRIVLTSGEIRHVHAEGETIRDSSGRPVKFFGTVQDITDRKLAEEALQRINAELEASNNELDAFVYSVSHDLRAPLRTIVGFSEILRDDYSDRLDEEGNEHLSRVIKGATRMKEIIEDLLRLSRISRQEVRHENVDLSEAAGSIFAELRRRHPDRRVTVDVQKALTARADPGLIEIALLNLLGNAWKYTSKTEDARIVLGSFEHEEKTVYYVKDNGAGFDQELAEKLFQPFKRLHSEQEFQGTGVGLTIVERVISRHGGKIWAEGKKNEGAVFYFTLN